jgi:hypothetical protein
MNRTDSAFAQSEELPSARMKSKSDGPAAASTRLERFICSRGLSPAKVAKASDICRTRLQVWRIGKAWPMLSSIRKLLRGIRNLTNDPTVTANDLFPLDDDE